MKRFHILEQHELEFRFETFNLPNHPNFGVPHATFTDSAFGQITNTANDMREIQFALKYIF